MERKAEEKGGEGGGDGDDEGGAKGGGDTAKEGKEGQGEEGVGSGADPKEPVLKGRVTCEEAREAIKAACRRPVPDGAKSGEGESDSRVHCFHCSMANCFGLQILYNYLNVPFLELKRYNLQQSLRVLEQVP